MCILSNCSIIVIDGLKKGSMSVLGTSKSKQWTRREICSTVARYGLKKNACHSLTVLFLSLLSAR